MCKKSGQFAHIIENRSIYAIYIIPATNSILYTLTD
jgi:hypothetical protein